MSDNISILSTVPVDERLVQTAASYGITLDSAAFISVEPVDKDQLEETIRPLLDTSLTAVFTSANAVNAIKNLAGDSKPEWTVYVIGHATYAAALSVFSENSVKPAGKNAEEVANTIVNDRVTNICFFCGDKRMDTLPGILRGSGIGVKEFIVYRTKETPVPMDGSYNGILFFSPSSVNSFFSLNRVGPDAVLFAIGDTTAMAIKKYAGNQVLISDTPSKEGLIADALTYFKERNPVTTG